MTSTSERAMVQPFACPAKKSLSPSALRPSARPAPPRPPDSAPPAFDKREAERCISHQSHQHLGRSDGRVHSLCWEMVVTARVATVKGPEAGIHYVEALPARAHGPQPRPVDHQRPAPQRRPHRHRALRDRTAALRLRGRPRRAGLRPDQPRRPKPHRRPIHPLPRRPHRCPRHLRPAHPRPPPQRRLHRNYRRAERLRCLHRRHHTKLDRPTRRERGPFRGVQRRLHDPPFWPADLRRHGSAA